MGKSRSLVWDTGVLGFAEAGNGGPGGRRSRRSAGCLVACSVTLAEHYRAVVCRVMACQ